MGGNALAARARDVAHRLDFRIGHDSLMGARPWHAFVARDVDLQRVDPFAHEVARRAAKFVRAVANVAEVLARYVRQARIAQAAGDGQLGARREQAWPRKITRLMASRTAMSKRPFAAAALLQEVNPWSSMIRALCRVMMA